MYAHLLIIYMEIINKQYKQRRRELIFIKLQDFIIFMTQYIGMLNCV